MGIHDYEKPSLTTDIALFRVIPKNTKDVKKSYKFILQVLLIKRGKEPLKDLLSLPGGFVGIEDSIELNVKQKLDEKAGITGDFYTEQLYTKGEIDRDPRGRVVSISYLGLGNISTLKESGSKLESEWYDVSEVLRGVYGELAFDHFEIILYALDRLKNKVEYTDIAFNLLPELFTIFEIQSIYETLLQKDISNFRRKISEYVLPTGLKTEGKQHRPAELYTLNNERKSRY